LQDHFARGRVKIPGGLVAEDDAGVIDEGAADGDTLALAAAELDRAVIETFAEADISGDFLGALATFAGRDPGVDQREFDIADDIEFREEIERLENKADLAVSHGGKRVWRSLAEIVSADHHLASGRRVEATEEMHECGFSAAARSDNCDEFSLVDREVDVIERADFLISDAIDFTDSLE
jgi:hypothetical protein